MDDTQRDFLVNVIASIEATGMVFYGERIAVIRDPEEEKTKGGLFIPDQARRKEPRGTVVAIGLGVDCSDDNPVTGLKVGDRVMYTKYNPIAFNVTLLDGQQVSLELMHVSDLYIGWRN